MGTKDQRIDAYITKSAGFAQPILKHLRQVVHRSCPDVEETLKWSMPTFMYKGMLCGMAAFKQHAVFGFWKQKLMKDPHKLFSKHDTAMGSWGRITSINDLPSEKILIDYIHEAMQLNERGVKVPQMRKHDRKPLRVPNYFKKALAKNKKALATFEAFSPSHKQEYLEWITEAKTDETRTRRIATTIEWLSQGKPRNWRYIEMSK
jgi:uncharacterized protein YdeI (YjbR/CyaY-like superfamily)